MNEIIRSISDASGKRRVDIYQRPDGTFGFEECHYDDEHEMWHPFGRYSQ